MCMCLCVYVSMCVCIYIYISFYLSVFVSMIRSAFVCVAVWERRGAANELKSRSTSEGTREPTSHDISRFIIHGKSRDSGWVLIQVPVVGRPAVI